MVTLTGRGVPVGNYLKDAQGFPDDGVPGLHLMGEPHAAYAIRTV